jgi:hypothetical protein
MTTYDRVAHTIGLAALGLLGASALGHVPGWIIILASVIAAATQATTAPIMSRPTVGDAVQASTLGQGK